MEGFYQSLEIRMIAQKSHNPISHLSMFVAVELLTFCISIDLLEPIRDFPWQLPQAGEVYS